METNTSKGSSMRSNLGGCEDQLAGTCVRVRTGLGSPPVSSPGRLAGQPSASLDAVLAWLAVAEAPAEAPPLRRLSTPHPLCGSRNVSAWVALSSFALAPWDVAAAFELPWKSNTRGRRAVLGARLVVTTMTCHTTPQNGPVSRVDRRSSRGALVRGRTVLHSWRKQARPQHLVECHGILLARAIGAVELVAVLQQHGHPSPLVAPPALRPCLGAVHYRTDSVLVFPRTFVESSGTGADKSHPAMTGSENDAPPRGRGTRVMGLGAAVRGALVPGCLRCPC